MSGVRAGLANRAESDGSFDLIGRVLGGSYRVVSNLDSGAMGAVFVAEQLRLHRQVAVKVLGQHSAALPLALERFELEAEAISRLSHPHVVQVLDFDHTDEGAPYLVMELLTGESLERRLERGPLDFDTAMTVALQVASGLVAAHAASVVHRDLKPANVFLVAMPDLSPFAKLLDFGISKKLDGSRKLTGQFDVIGTPDYMSPEQASGATARVGPQGDQFSLAVITYEMLSGEVPFAGSTVMEVLQKVITQPAPRLVDRVPGLPEGVDLVLQRALEKNPADRFPDVAAFATELAVASGRSAGCSSVPRIRISNRSPSPHSAATLLALGDANANARTAGLEVGQGLARGPQSAVRPKTSPAPGIPRVDPAPATLILSMLSEAHHALASGDLTLAWAHVEAARAETEHGRDGPDGPALLQLIEGDTELAATLLGSSIGQPGSGPLDHPLAVSSDRALNPKEAFLLSRFREGDTLEHLLDLSPMPRHETLWMLADLARRGVVRTA